MILLAAAGLILACLPFLLKQIRRQRHEQLLARQLREALQSMVHSLKIGTSFLQAVARAAQDGEDPLSREWKILIQSIQMGTPTRHALADLGKRVPLKEMAWFVTASQITQETGGSLSTVLDSLASSLQDRETLREKVSALTAQGKASGALLSALPFLMMAALFVIAPEMISPLFTTAIGQALVSGIVLMVSIGGWVIFKIVSIKVE